MFQEIILAFHHFPGAETIHLLQGVVVGFLLATGYLKEKPARVIIALTLLIGFAIYEGYERWRILDNADTDFSIFLITSWITGIITFVCHVVWRAWRNTDGDS